MTTESKADLRATIERDAVIESHMPYKGRRFKVLSDLIKPYESQSYRRDIVLAPDAAAVVAVTKDKNILFVRQWRRAVDQVLLELPAGLIDSDETPVAAANRELQEEVGFRSENLIPLGKHYSSAGFTNEALYLFLATDLIPSQLPADENEDLEIVEINIIDALEMIDCGQIEDSKTIIGLYKYVMYEVAHPKPLV